MSKIGNLNSKLNKRLLNAQEAADYIGASEHTVRSWANIRKIPSVKIGRSLRFDIEKLDKWIDSQSIPPFAA